MSDMIYKIIETADWLSAIWRQIWDTKKSIDGLADIALTFRRLNVVVRSLPLYSKGGPKWRENYPEGHDHPVAPNCLETFFRLAVHW